MLAQLDAAFLRIRLSSKKRHFSWGPHGSPSLQCSQCLQTLLCNWVQGKPQKSRRSKAEADRLKGQAVKQLFDNGYISALMLRVKIVHLLLSKITGAT